MTQYQKWLLAEFLLVAAQAALIGVAIGILIGVRL